MTIGSKSVVLTAAYRAECQRKESQVKHKARPMALPPFRKYKTRMQEDRIGASRRDRVTFEQAVQVQLIPTPRNREDLWYSAQDYKLIANRNKILLLKMMGHPKAQTITLGEETTLGLAWQLPKMRKQREERYRAAVSVVVSGGPVPLCANDRPHQTTTKEHEPQQLSIDSSQGTAMRNVRTRNDTQEESVAVIYGLLSESYVEAAARRAHHVARFVRGEDHGDGHCEQDEDINSAYSSSVHSNNPFYGL